MRVRRRSNDLLRTIVVLSVLLMVSMTMHTLPYLQSMLDGACCSSASPSLPPSFNKMLKAVSSTNSSRDIDECWNHQAVQASTHKLKTNASTILLWQPTAACGRLKRHDYWKAPTRSSAAANHRNTNPFLSPLAVEIQNWQSDCSKPVLQFPVDNDYGLGSHLYQWSQALCNAWEVGARIQTYNPSWLWADQSYCNIQDENNNNKSPLLCYFPLAEQRCGETNSSSNHHHLSPVISNVSDVRKHKCARLAQNNETALREFRAASMEFLFHQAVSEDVVLKEAQRQLGLLFPPHGIAPSDLIAVHMRWGDKFWEMDLAPAEEYVEAVKQLLGDSTNDNTTTSTARANIYLACEDPRAVEAFVQAAPAHWKIYTDRTIAELNDFRPKKGNRASWAAKNTKGRAGLVALGSLLVALEANDFVLTTASNWSRLIDELRRNVLDRRCNNCTRMIDLRPGLW